MNTDLSDIIKLVMSAASEVDVLITDGEFEQALGISKAVLLNMNEAIKQADDSTGYIGRTAHNAIDCLYNIAVAEDVPGKIQDALFAFLTDVNILGEFIDYDWHYELMETAVVLAGSKPREERLFSAAEELIGCSGDVSSYAFSWYQQLRLAWLKMFASALNVESFIDENIDIPDFRKMKLEQLFSDSQYDEVIRIARSGLEKDGELPGLVRDWREWILKGAEEKNDMEMQQEVLYQLYNNSHSMEYFKRLKSRYPASRWTDLRNEIIASLKNHWRHKADVFIEEKMFDDLWCIVSENSSLDVLSRYDSYLLPRYKREIMALYSRLIPEFLHTSVGRKHYRRIGNLISGRTEHLGDDFRKKITSHLLQAYPNRPAMREEFLLAGIL